MIELNDILNAWGKPDFNDLFKVAVAQMDEKVLPLQQGLSQGSYASVDNLGVMILNVSDDSDHIHVKTGIFYTGLLPGCGCADDPSPEYEYTEYCEVQFDINKVSAETTITLLEE